MLASVLSSVVPAFYMVVIMTPRGRSYHAHFTDKELQFVQSCMTIVINQVTKLGFEAQTHLNTEPPPFCNYIAVWRLVIVHFYKL